MDEQQIANALEPQVRIYESDFGSLEDTSPEGYARSLAPVVAYLIRRAKAEAWDEGHRTLPIYGPDNCECWAYSESECGCGLWGSNVITVNPYRD